MAKYLLGNNTFVTMGKESALGTISNWTNPINWFQTCNMNKTANPINIPYKSGYSMKSGCQDKYIDFDYQVILSGHLTSGLAQLIFPAWLANGLLNASTIGTDTMSYSIIQLDIDEVKDPSITTPKGRLATGCVLKSIELNKEPSGYVEVTVTYMAKHITDWEAQASVPSLPVTDECEALYSTMELLASPLNITNSAASQATITGMSLMLDTQFADKFITHTNNVLSTPTYINKIASINISNVISSDVAMTAYSDIGNNFYEAGCITLTIGNVKIKMNNVQLTSANLPDPEKGIWIQQTTLEMIAGGSATALEDPISIIL